MAIGESSSSSSEKYEPSLKKAENGMKRERKIN
jgi:hypothetical protein